MRPELEDTLAAPADVAPVEPRTATALGRATTRPTAPGLQTGQQLGHFRIERRIGAGGMGEVYLATDLALDRPVAIKVLPEALAKDASRRDRMVREARAQARVAHPNVGHIYFVGEEAGLLYFAMEHVAGETLAERIAKGPLSVEDALGVIRAAALGLREAQRSGFTHRDVKPSNLMIDGHGVVKVLDFGLAAGDPGALEQGPVAQTSLAGTPLYMAPEQARGEAVDFRTDIYALGATLYHLISGKPPFQADSVDELLTLHASATRPTVPRRGLPRTQIGAIDALIGKMMAARADDRFASYDELLRAIELASSTHTRPAGLFVRAIATAIDFIVLSIVTVISVFVMRLALGGNVGNIQVGPLVLPLYGVYAWIATRRFGRTLGQSLFEIEVVDVVTHGRPRWGQAAKRALTTVALPGIAVAIPVALDIAGYQIWDLGELVIIALAVANGFLLLWASARAAGKRALWDRLSGTMVRYRTAPAVVL
ncbi:MAG: protein kinase [Deltaproteobacteria bacterium]|nr:protein kinase [Deltaproteobacteria bacterium]MDQ3301313.1 protein kinase [Myxococcota bacterium]